MSRSRLGIAPLRIVRVSLLAAPFLLAVTTAPEARPRAPLDLTVQSSDYKPRIPYAPGYRAVTRPDPWETLGDADVPEAASEDIPQQRAERGLPVGIDVLDGLLEGETIPLFRIHVRP